MANHEQEFDPLANLFNLGQLKARKEELIDIICSLEVGSSNKLHFPSILTKVELYNQIQDLENKISQIEDFSKNIDVSTPSNSHPSKPVLPNEEWLEEGVKA